MSVPGIASTSAAKRELASAIAVWTWATAAAVRLVFVLGLGQRAYHPEALLAAELGRDLAGGHLPVLALLPTPALPVLYAVAHRLAGGGFQMVARFIVLAIGLGTLALTVALSRTLSGPRASLLALFIGALSPTLVFASGLVAVHGVAAGLLAGGVLAALRCAERPGGLLRSALVGVCALAAASDPLTFLPMGVVLAWLTVFSWVQNGARITAVASGLGALVALGLAFAGEPRHVLVPTAVFGSGVAGVVLTPAVALASFFVPLPGVEPGSHPLTAPSSVLATLAYYLPLTCLAIVGWLRGRAPAHARGLLAAVVLSTAVLAVFRGQAVALRVISAPMLVVSAALGLEHWLLARLRAPLATGAEPLAALTNRMRSAGAWRIVAMGVGLGLFSLTAAGLSVPLRNPELARLSRDWRRATPFMTEQQVYEVLRSPAMDSSGNRASYLERATLAVHAGLQHVWDEADAERFSMRVPIYENWALFAMGWIYPSRFRLYEFVDYRRALARGVGICSEYAIVTCDALRERGIPARIVVLSGHVVAAAQSDPATNKWSILDADLGVMIPHSPGVVAADPVLADSAYRAAGYSAPLSREYSAKYGAGKLELYAGAAAYAHPRRWFAERVSYVLIWLVPALMVAPFAIFTVRPMLGR